MDDRKTAGSLGAADELVQINFPGASVVAAQVTGTFTATLTFEVNVDEGSSPTWVAVAAANVNTGVRATTTTGTGIFLIPCAGARGVRVRCSAYTSGTAVVTLNATLGMMDFASLGAAAGGGSGPVDTEFSAAETLTEGSANTATTKGGAILMADNGGGTYNRIRIASAVADGSSGGQSLPAVVWNYNGTTLDRVRNNIDATLLASAARTTTQTSADITTYNARGITVVLDVTSITDTPSLVVTIDGKDAVSGKYYNILTGAAVTTVSTNPYKVLPGVTVAANAAVSQPLPRVIRIVVTAADSDSATYSVGYTLHV